MKKFETRIDTKSPEFEKNRSAYLELVATLRDRQQFAIDGGVGREKSIARHLDRDKLMARNRIGMVTDYDTPFLEFSTLAGWEQYDNSAPGAGIVTGVCLLYTSPSPRD